MDQNKRKWTTGKVCESNNDALDIDSLPNEVISRIFGYLKQNQFGRIAQVCRRWNALTKSRVLWKKVNVRLSPFPGDEMIMLKSFISRLPSCVTSFKLNFIKYLNYWLTLDFGEFCVKLQQNCPHVEELVLDNSELRNNSLLSVTNLCTQFLPKVKKLAFHGCVFPADISEEEELAATSKIEVLILSQCRIRYVNNQHFSNMFECVINPQFSRMPDLKVLCLYRTNVDKTWFEGDSSFLNQLHVLNVGFTNFRAFSVIEKHGLHLKELYLCSVYIHGFRFNHSAFPHLETICFSCTGVTSEYVDFLIQSCPSLENVYVDKHVAEYFAAHSVVIANRCKSEVVKAISKKHEHNLDYSYA